LLNIGAMIVMFVANKAQQLIQGLSAAGDEGQQLSAVIELCQVSLQFLIALEMLMFVSS